MVSTDLSVGLQGQAAFSGGPLRCSVCSPRETRLWRSCACWSTRCLTT